jgi:hypothetical protein
MDEDYERLGTEGLSVVRWCFPPYQGFIRYYTSKLRSREREKGIHRKRMVKRVLSVSLHEIQWGAGLSSVIQKEEEDSR